MDVQRLLPALVETIGQRAYFSVEKYCWRLFNLASLNINEKVKFAKFAKYKGFTVPYYEAKRPHFLAEHRRLERNFHETVCRHMQIN